MMKLLSVKAVPSVSWSSEHPLNFRPRLKTLLILCSGLIVFGIGEASLIAAGAGVSPWTVFAQGIGIVTGLSIGWATFVVSVGVLLLWIPLKQTPGLGTLLNAIIISAAIELSLPYLPQPSMYGLKIVQSAIGVLLVGMGSGLYLIAHLGAGPRDGLMTGLQRVTNFPIAWVRTALEITAVLFGWLLGGTLGLGTLMFAFGIGPAVSIGLYLVHHWSNTDGIIDVVEP
ncbi:MAG: hypothetical protein O2971_13800 [Proteobacteria bacterium]|nr:hypothetical protein [Pseudomonadota bacterium]